MVFVIGDKVVVGLVKSIFKGVLDKRMLVEGRILVEVERFMFGFRK